MRKAFTILELLVVVAIVAILAIAAIPNFVGRIQEAENAKYLAEISSVKTATSSYFIENGSYPTEQGDQPTLGDPKNIKFSSLISGGFLTKLPTFSNWYIDYIGQVIHTEDTWQIPTAQVVVTDTKTGAKITLGTNFKGTEPHPEAGSSDEPTPDLGYTGTDFTATESAGVLTITGYTGTSKDVVIPSKINGKTVTSIGDSAFNNKLLTSLVLPDSLTSIGRYGLARNKFTSVIIPNSVTFIDNYAFAMGQLTSVTIGTNVTLQSSSIYSTFDTAYNNASKAAGTYTAPSQTGVWTKYDPGYTGTDFTTTESAGVLTITGYTGSSLDVTIPSKINGKTVTSIGDDAFSDNQLESVTIPNSVTTIGNNAFSDNQLTSVTIPNSVTSIGGSAFETNRLESVTIPDSVKYIWDSAFSDNQLESVTIPNSVTSIGNYAFRNNQLKEVTIPANVTIQSGSISAAFYNAYTPSLAAGTYTAPSQTGPWIHETLGYTGTDFTTTESDGVLTITGYTGASKDVTIPSKINGKTVTTIGTDAFYNKQLTAVTIPNSVTTIGDNALRSNQLASVTIPDSVTTIGNFAFSDNQLESVTIPNSVTTIGNNAFSDNQLTSVTIPNSVTTIGNNAFRNNQLKEVTIPNSVTSIGNNAFQTNLLTSVTIPADVYMTIFSISNTFYGAYNPAKAAGTYTAPSQAGAWTKQP